MTRCPGCLNWRANRDMVGDIVYEVVDDAQIFTAKVCRNCIAKTSNEDRASVFKSVHTYYTGEGARMSTKGKWLPFPVGGGI